eukprot:g411.t1
MSTDQMQPETMIASARAQGNSAFKAGDFVAAEAKYSEAIKLTEKDCYKDRHKLFSNRSACYMKLSKPAKALEDAEEAIKCEISWAKGYHRKGLALLALGKPRDAYSVYEDYVTNIDSKNTFMKKQLETVRNEIPIESISEFLEIFKSLRGNIRMRLFCLAYFWNRSKRQERLQILKTLMTIIGGATGPSAAVQDFTPQQMNRLPLDIYDDLSLPKKWLTWYQNEPKKVELLKSLWLECTGEEHNYIIQDLQAFFNAQSDAAGAVRATAGNGITRSRAATAAVGRQWKSGEKK